MLGPIGSEIMSIFRLLSPHEIDKYIVEEKADSYKVGQTNAVAANGESINLSTDNTGTDLLDDDSSKKFPKDHEAKIIPLHSDDDNEKEKKRLSSEINKGDSLESIGVLSASKIKEIEKERLERERKKKDSATVFILKERERMRNAKRKMIEQIALKSYQENSSQEFLEATEEELENDDLNVNDIKGILLNKKHF